MLTVEKVVTLKSTQIFAQTSDFSLVSLASITATEDAELLMAPFDLKPVHNGGFSYLGMSKLQFLEVAHGVITPRRRSEYRIRTAA